MEEGEIKGEGEEEKVEERGDKGEGKRGENMIIKRMKKTGRREKDERQRRGRGVGGGKRG